MESQEREWCRLFDVGEKILFIHPKRRFSENDLKRLVVHEIGTHITRAEMRNGDINCF